MKKTMKQIVALLCVFTMIAGLILSELKNVVHASSIADEWNMFSAVSGTNVVTGEGKLYYACDNANVVLPETSQNMDTLELSIKIWLENNDAVTVMKNSYFELANETCDKKERWWFLSEHVTFVIGMNEIRVPLSKAHSDAGTGEGSGEFALDDSIKYFRMYNIDTSTTNVNSIKLYDVSLCEPDKYITFNNSGYFQLTNPLSEAPDTISTSIKADVRDSVEEEAKVTTWPLLTTGAEIEAASKLHNSNNAVTHGTVKEGEGGPKSGTAYTQISVDSGQAFGFHTDYKAITTIPNNREYQQEDLVVTFWLWCEKENVLPVTEVILSSEGWSGTDNIKWNLADYSPLKAGWNYIELPLDDYTFMAPTFDYTNILYAGVRANEYQVSTDVWKCYPVTDDCSFRVTDMNLSVRRDIDREVDTLIAAGDKLEAAAMPNSIYYNQTVSEGFITGDEANDFTPSAGTKYTEIKVNMEDTTLEDGITAVRGGRFGFRTTYQGIDPAKFTVTKYDESELAIGFWLYNETGEALPAGWVRVSSEGWQGKQERVWETSQYIKTSQGWNYVELPLDDFTVDIEGENERSGPFDYKNIRFMCFDSEAGTMSAANTFRITDIELVVRKETQDINTLSTLRSARKVTLDKQGGWWWTPGTRTLLQTTSSYENGPEIGTTYMKLDVTTEQPQFSFTQEFDYRVPSGYDMEDVALSFWLYSSFDGNMPGADRHIRLGSNTTEPDANEIYWDWSKISLQKGWNYIQLNFADAIKVGTFDLQNMKVIRWHGGAGFTSGATLGISDMKLIDLNASYQVTTKKVTDTTTITNSQMLFSNMNASGETSPYALYLDNFGYPTLLWGTTAYTLNYNVCNDTWTDIKVTRNENKTVSFYIDDVLIASSKATDLLAEDTLNFATAHCIGADGNEDQLFNGTIAKLAISNQTAQTGAWTMRTDTDYMLNGIADETSNNNTAIWHGGYVEKWSIYQTVEGATITAGSTNIYKVIQNDVNVAANATMDNLSLQVTVDLANDAAIAALKTCYMELTNETADQKELTWSWAGKSLTVGENTIDFPLAAATPNNGYITNEGYGAFNLRETIGYWRIYGSSNGIAASDLLIKEIKLVARETEKETEELVPLPKLFTDGMLFQQNKPMNMWGYATTGTEVTAVLSDGTGTLETQTGIADANGKWELSFSSRAGSYNAYSIKVKVGTFEKTINDVLIGELWVSGGQSNMELTVNTDMDSKDILVNATDKYIRIFLEPSYQPSMRPVEKQTNLPSAHWGYGNVQADVRLASSVAYSFAKNLRAKLDVPVGFINTAQGGSIMESWLSAEAIESDSEVKAALQEYDLYFNEENYEDIAGMTSTLYNQKIAPLEGLNIAGTIWYQGESNSNRSEIYDIELALLKESWGKVFGFTNGDMPFIFSQVAPYNYDHGNTNNQHLGYLAMYMERGYQLCDPETTAMLTVYDMPLEHMRDGVTSDPIHPRIKTPVGERFFQSALNLVYGGTEEYTAPVYKSMEVKGNAIYVTFDHVGEGLATTDLSMNVHGFTIAGADGVYVNAQAEIIDKDTVKVWNNRVSEPKNAMYAFDNYNQGANLCNSVNIPASPMRTVTYNDTTLKPESSIQYFTAQDWMYADKDVWVYDATNTAEYGAGFRPAFAVEGGSYSYDTQTLTEGNASLKVTYDADCSVSPILSYKSIQQDWSNFKSISVKVLNSNATNVSISMSVTEDSTSKQVTTIEGADAAQLNANGKLFQEITFDLSGVSNVTEATFHISTEEAGSIFFDEFFFGMTEEVEQTDKVAQVKEYTTGVVAGTAPTDVPEGYLFAGWFTDDTCSTALTPGSTATKAYAKYVDNKILGVKAQITAGTTKDSSETSMRFVTTVDSVDYQEVGFYIQPEGSEQKKCGSETVYEKIMAVGDSGTILNYTPTEEFSSSSKYFMTYTLYGIPNVDFSVKITVIPYWVTLDGTIVTATQTVKSVSMGY